MAPSAPTREIGHSRLQTLSLPGWETLGGDAEHVPTLAWPASVNTYHRMRADPQIASLLDAVFLPVRRRKWVIDPAGARDEVVEQIASDLAIPLRGEQEPPSRNRKRFSHDDHLRHALLALVYGHMFFEQVGTVQEEGPAYWRLRKLSPRMPQTISRIVVAKDGGLEAIEQHGTSFIKPDQIPVGALAAYVWNREGANWAGRSMLREVYQPWLLKDRLSRIDTLKNERFGIGIPTATAPPGARQQDLAEYAALASNATAGERSGVGLPNGATVGVEGFRGALPDTLGSIRYWDEQMARRFLAMFMQLGQTQTGSRALGDTFVDVWTLMLDAICTWYATITNEHVIEDQVDWNWGEDEPAPRITWEVDESQPATVDELVRLIDAGLITVDRELEDWIRAQKALPALPEQNPDAGPVEVQASVAELGALIQKVYLGVGKVLTVPEARAILNRAGADLDLPGPDLAVEDTAPEPEPAAAGEQIETPPEPRGDGFAPLSTGRQVDRVEAAAQTVTRDEVGHRSPFDHEVRAATDFGKVQQVWTEATEDIVADWKAIRSQQIEALVAQAVAAVEAGTPVALASLQAPVLGAELIEDRMMKLAQQAATAARAEAAAQGVTIAAIDGDALRPIIANRAQATAVLLARGLGDSAATNAFQRYGTTADVAAVEAGLREHLEGLSDAYLNDQLGGALTQAQNTARRAVFASGPRATIYASELLDGNTCTNCAQVDGTRFDSLQAAESIYPTGGHQDCLGGPRCRGTLVAVYGDEADVTA